MLICAPECGITVTVTHVRVPHKQTVDAHTHAHTAVLMLNLTNTYQSDHHWKSDLNRIIEKETFGTFGKNLTLATVKKQIIVLWPYNKKTNGITI